jgi:hypothetical protein
MPELLFQAHDPGLAARQRMFKLVKFGKILEDILL